MLDEKWAAKAHGVLKTKHKKGKDALQKKNWGCWLAAIWTWANSVPRQQRLLTASWPVWRRAWPAGPGQWLSPCPRHWWGHTSNPVLSFELLTPREAPSCWGVSREEQQSWEESRRRLRGVLTALYNYLKWCRRGDQSLVPGNKWQGKRKCPHILPEGV